MSAASISTYPTIRLALRMILLTLVRKSELIKAIWDEVDFEIEVWTISKERMKGRNSHVVYLSRQALHFIDGCFGQKDDMAQFLMVDGLS